MRADDEAGRAYDAVAADYFHYADGSGEQLFTFDSRYAFADREVWQRIDAALIDLRAQGLRTIRILDLGCGPGTWLIRALLRARSLGFDHAVGFGVDISAELIGLARDNAARIGSSGIEVAFAVRDLQQALAGEAPGSCDLVLCLYGVLNHLPSAAHASIAAGMARVADGRVVLTVRAACSPPSIFVTGIEDARAYHQDHDRDRLAVDLKDGRHLEFDSHLFASGELRQLFEPVLDIQELVGIDLFHSRFKHDPHWHRDGPIDAGFEARLAGLEHFCASDPEMIDHAAHILLSGVVRRAR